PAATDGTCGYTIPDQSCAHIFCSTVLDKPTKSLRYCFGVNLMYERILFASAPWRGIHFAHKPSFTSFKAKAIIRRASRSSEVPKVINTSSQRPSSGAFTSTREARAWSALIRYLYNE